MAEEWNTEDMLGTYLFENTQLLENLQEIVLEQQDADCFDEDSINEIFRAMHTIKGSSAIMAFDGITKTAHKLEDIFYFLRESHPQNVPHMELITHVLDVEDFISGELNKIQDGDKADGDCEPLIAELDAFLNKIKTDQENTPESAPQQEKNIQINLDDTPAGEEDAQVKDEQHIYIPPKASENSHFYLMKVTYHPELELVNIHAFKLVHKLKAIAENIRFFPQDILTTDDSVQKILDDGFQVFLHTDKTEKELRESISLGYDIKQLTITECTQKEFEESLVNMGVVVKTAPAPGDFVIPLKNADKEETAVSPAAPADAGRLEKLVDLTVRLECLEAAVIQNPDLKAEGLKLDRFEEAACQMSAVFSDLKQEIAALGGVFPKAEKVEKQINETLQQIAVTAEPEFEDEEEDDESETLKDKYMTFQSGNEYFGLKISYVTEVIIYQEITEFPESPDYIKGIIHLRGKVVPIIDVRVRFGQESLDCNDKTCIIVISYRDHMVGLMVERIAEVVEIPKEKLLPPPKVGWSDGMHNQYVRAVGKVGDSIKLLIDPRRLVSEEEMTAMEQIM